MPPIRVLNVVGRMDRGGIETFVMNLYRHIDRDQVQFDFLAHYGRPDAHYNEEIRSLGGRVYEMPAIKSPTSTRYWMLPHYRRALSRFFSEHQQYKVVHGHMTNTASIYFPIARKQGGATCLIAHSHLARARKGLSGKVTDLLQRNLAEVATERFACSSNAARWLFGDALSDAGGYTFVPNAIDTEDFAYSQARRDDMRKALGVDDKFVVGHVGRFYYEKNHEFLIRVFEKIFAADRSACLLLVGEGDLEADLRRQVQAAGLKDHVRFLGSRGDVSDLMQAMDSFIFPSRFEGLPVSAIEAQTAGLPCTMSEAVTREADVSGNVLFLPLSTNMEQWALAGLRSASVAEREAASGSVRSEGYEIRTIAQALQTFYLQHHHGVGGSLKVDSQ